MGHLSPPLSIWFWQVLVDLTGNCVDGTSAPPLSKCLLANYIGLKGNCVDGKFCQALKGNSINVFVAPLSLN
jgi:hypothetical protein